MLSFERSIWSRLAVLLLSGSVLVTAAMPGLEADLSVNDEPAADIPPVRITSADLTYSADARAGLATAAFTPNPEDTTSDFVIITYADGVREDASMMNMVAMGGPSGWRMNIGTEISTGSPAPPPAAASPLS